MDPVHSYYSIPNLIFQLLTILFCNLLGVEVELMNPPGRIKEPGTDLFKSLHFSAKLREEQSGGHFNLRCEVSKFLTYVTFRDEVLGTLETMRKNLPEYSSKYTADQLYFDLGSMPVLRMVKILLIFIRMDPVHLKI